MYDRRYPVSDFLFKFDLCSGNDPNGGTGVVVGDILVVFLIY
jgi:hypothetical protein